MAEALPVGAALPKRRTSYRSGRESCDYFRRSDGEMEFVLYSNYGHWSTH
jgi:hypothetical protein